MNVSALPGWGADPDLEQLSADWPVRIEMIDTYHDVDQISDVAKVMRYQALYRRYGAWALPPVVCLGDGGWQIAGAHRMQAAHRAGLRQVPAFIVISGK